MKRYRLSDLSGLAESHAMGSILPGEYLCAGGLAFTKPGERSHTHDGPDGRDYHVHPDCEAFVILQGTGMVEIDGSKHPLVMGDIVVAEPGEDHHLISSESDPLVTLWLHAGPNRHKNQL
jgi:mannose-6-phosphate isomerase-like protein (cupin superfamily)